MAARRWTPPAYSPSELDRLILGVCSPQPALPPLWVPLEPLLKRAVELDVFPLVFHRLRRSPRWLPGKTSPHWEERFCANAARNLALESEQHQLIAALSAAGLTVMPLKGLQLAQLAYGDLALRQQVDIDLYVPPPQLSAAFEVLTRRGYLRSGPAALPVARLAATGDFYRSGVHLLSKVAGLPVQVELHWRILPMEAPELDSCLVTSEQGKQLPPELNFLYLGAHASADFWGSFKSLTDLAHLLVRQPLEWESVLAAAERLGLRRILYVTLAVLLNYFDVLVPEEVRQRLDAARPRRMPREAVANPFAPLPALTPAVTHRLRGKMRERIRDRIGYATNLLRPTAGDLAAVGLPAGWGFLYWGIRWLRLAGLLGAPERRQHVALEG